MGREIGQQSSEVDEKLEYLIWRLNGFVGDLAFCYSADSKFTVCRVSLLAS